MSLGLPALVAGIVSHSMAEDVAIFRGVAVQWMILGELQCRLSGFFTVLQRLLIQPRVRADGISTGLLDQLCRIFPA
ncbi:hypothetical protein [Mesorhizobium caraganae]|uniref:hypothetical protein n=1 Tax=Mesorhizobium caraganae TaxID=483206 RepID=UPI003F4F4442